jgi:arylsulfatase A-like enzyme
MNETANVWRHSGSALSALLATILAAACGGAHDSSPIAIRLVDLHDRTAIEGDAGGETTPPARTEWRFDAAPSPPPETFAATHGWEAGPGIADLAVRDGRLAGRTTRDLSVLHLANVPDPSGRDTLHAVEIRMLASAGANVQVDLNGREELDLERAVADFTNFSEAMPSSPLVADGEMRTYTIEPVTTVVASDIRHVLIRPSDVAGARFEIESVRLVFRHEYLENIPSGVSWQGLSEIYAESLVSRSPETLRFGVTVPRHARLDVAIGTVEDAPVTFRVAVERGGDEAQQLLLERTVTRPYRWERVPLDLSAFGGEEVTLALGLSAAHRGAIGFWGSPVVRSLDARPATARAGAPPRGVILIWADTLRRDHLGVYGYGRDTSPVLDAMARDGVLFRDSVSQATWTKVSTPTLMTSLYPSTHGVADFTDRLPAGATTLAEVFREAGFATLSMSSILFTGRFTNLHQGFEEVHESGSLPDQESSKTARDYVDRLLPWLDAHRDVPFFVLLHVSDPHDPYRPYPPYDSMWADLSRAAEHEKRAVDVREHIADPLLRIFGMPNREELVRAGIDPQDYADFDRAWYDGSIRAMDAEIGRVLEHLRGLGLDDDTLVVFTGDHGEEFLEHGRMFHGQTVYGELTNMPLILWGPGVVPRGVEVAQTVETVDLMPTILDLAGLPIPDAAQGSSLVPLVLGAEGSPGDGVAAAAAGESEPAFSEKAVTRVGGGGPPPHDTESFAITLDGFKLVHNTRRPDGRPEFELYDARGDALNLADVAASHPEVVERLARSLAAWREAVADAALASDAEASQELSPAELERLRSLGYVQ